MYVAFDSMMALQLNGTMALVVVIEAMRPGDWPLIDQRARHPVARAGMLQYRKLSVLSPCSSSR